MSNRVLGTMKRGNSLEPCSKFEAMTVGSVRFVPFSVDVVGCRTSCGSFVPGKQAVFFSDRLSFRVGDSSVVHRSAWMNGLSLDGRHGRKVDPRSIVEKSRGRRIKGNVRLEAFLAFL